MSDRRDRDRDRHFTILIDK